MAWEWTEQLENNVLEAIESGLTLRQVAKENGISAAAIIRHVQANEVFAKQYAHAMDVRTEADCDALVDVISEAPQTTKFGVDAGWVQWKRVQIDTVKWLLSKRNPKKYSDKVALTAADGGPVQIQFAAKSILEDGK
jgi:hypothetical protein